MVPKDAEVDHTIKMQENAIRSKDFGSYKCGNVVNAKTATKSRKEFNQ
jgi:hypothetical protein